MIRLRHKQDLAFASIAQESLVSGTIMPSGLQIPREGKWIIKESCVVLHASSPPVQNDSDSADVTNEELIKWFTQKNI